MSKQITLAVTSVQGGSSSIHLAPAESPVLVRVMLGEFVREDGGFVVERAALSRALDEIDRDDRIAETMVERAAWAAFEADLEAEFPLGRGPSEPNWDLPPGYVKAEYMNRARVMLAAAFTRKQP